MPAPTSLATRARLAMVAAALALFATLAVPTISASVGVRAMGALPACRYDDVLTSPRGYAAWSKTLVDTILRVTRTYLPPDLVPVTEAGIPGKGETIRAIAIDDLRDMGAAAKAAGAAIGVESAYRSYDEQQKVFDSWVTRLGHAEALKVSARPGHSEHQLGLAIDFRSNPREPLTLNTDWEKTAAGMWMAAHAWEYGWVMSYPKDSIDLVCYSFEPWHFRYLGRALAALVHASGLTLREYLWANFTTTVVPPPPRASGAPGVTPKPTTGPTLEPTATAGAAPTEVATPTPLPTTGGAGSPSPSAMGTLQPPSAASTDPPADGTQVASIGVAVVVGGVAIIAVVILGASLAIGRAGSRRGGSAPPSST